MLRTHQRLIRPSPPRASKVPFATLIWVTMDHRGNKGRCILFDIVVSIISFRTVLDRDSRHCTAFFLQSLPIMVCGKQHERLYVVRICLTALAYSDPLEGAPVCSCNLVRLIVTT